VFYVKYNKTHKSRLKYEIKMMCIKFDPKIKNKNKKPKFWTRPIEVFFYRFLNLKNLGFFEVIFQRWSISFLTWPKQQTANCLVRV